MGPHWRKAGYETANVNYDLGVYHPAPCRRTARRRHWTRKPRRSKPLLMTQNKMLAPHLLFGRALLVLGYALVACGAILAPAAYAFDLLETLPAIAIALLIIAVGIALVLVADKVAGDDPSQIKKPGEGSASADRAADRLG